MKNRLFSLLYLLALAFGANAFADEEDYNEPKKEEEQVEGEVEEAKENRLFLQEGNVDNLFLDTVVKVVGGLLQKGGMPSQHAKKMAEETAQKLHEEVTKEQQATGAATAANSLYLGEGNVDGLFLDTVVKVVGGLLQKGGVPHEHATKVAKHAAQQVHEEVQKEGGATAMPATSNSLYMTDGTISYFDWKGALGKGLSIASTLLSKGHAPEQVKEKVAQAMQEHAEQAAAGKTENRLMLHENVDAIDWGKIAKTGVSILGTLLNAGVPPAKAAEHAAKATTEIHEEETN